MLYKQWANSTSVWQHGVCEAASSIWLQRIQDRGVEKASEIKPDECNALQSKVESGEYTWALGLSEVVDGAEVNAFDPQHTKPKNFTSRSNTLPVLMDLSQNRFCFFAANKQSGGGHALAAYYDGSTYWFFDPDAGIYKGTADEVADHIVERLKYFPSVSGAIGTYSQMS